MTCLISDEAPASRFQQIADDLAMVQVIRPMYSNPPRHGAAIVTAILSDPELYSQWKVSTFGVQHFLCVCTHLYHCIVFTHHMCNFRRPLLLSDDLHGVDSTDTAMHMFKRAERRQDLEANGHVAG